MLSVARPSAPSGSADRWASVPELERRPAAAAREVVERALARADDVLARSPAETRELLDAYGMPLVPERLAGSADDAVAAAARARLPAVVKSAAAGRPQDRDRRRRAGPRRRRGSARGRRADRLRRSIVQPMLRGGTELLAGLVQDPVFGPLVAFGPGGVFAELIGDASLRIAPLTDIDAEELVTAGKAGRLVRGFRGAPPADVGGARRPRPPSRRSG